MLRVTEFGFPLEETVAHIRNHLFCKFARDNGQHFERDRGNGGKGTGKTQNDMQKRTLQSNSLEQLELKQKCSKQNLACDTLQQDGHNVKKN